MTAELAMMTDDIATLLFLWVGTVPAGWIGGRVIHGLGQPENTHGLGQPGIIRPLWGLGRLPRPHRGWMIMAGVLALSWSMAWITVPSPWLPPACLLAWVLTVLAVIDLRSYRLPDALTVPLAVSGLIVNGGLGPAAPGGFWDHGLGWIGGFGVLAGINLAYRQWRGRDGLGLGDAKLVGAAGAWMGWAALPQMIVMAALSALVWLAFLVLTGQHRGRDTPIPFGPFLCTAFWLIFMAIMADYKVN